MKVALFSSVAALLFIARIFAGFEDDYHYYGTEPARTSVSPMRFGLHASPNDPLPSAEESEVVASVAKFDREAFIMELVLLMRKKWTQILKESSPSDKLTLIKIVDAHNGEIMSPALVKVYEVNRKVFLKLVGPIIEFFVEQLRGLDEFKHPEVNLRTEASIRVMLDALASLSKEEKIEEIMKLMKDLAPSSSGKQDTYEELIDRLINILGRQKFRDVADNFDLDVKFVYAIFEKMASKTVERLGSFIPVRDSLLAEVKNSDLHINNKILLKANDSLIQLKMANTDETPATARTRKMWIVVGSVAGGIVVIVAGVVAVTVARRHRRRTAAQVYMS